MMTKAKFFNLHRNNQWGATEYENRTYYIISEPHFVNDYLVEAEAACFEDEVSDYNELPLYRVFWKYNRSEEDFEKICDWFNPYDVEECGCYDLDLERRV